VRAPRWFDKIGWNDFEQPQAGLKGEGQECPESSTSLHQEEMFNKHQFRDKKHQQPSSKFKRAGVVQW
jgi:hypothetical protein